mgnify:CR=1 FL=1
MELNLLEKDKTSIKIEIINPEETLIYPLVSTLLQDEDVSDAQYYTGHPQLDKPVLYVRTKKNPPQAALKRAAEALAGQFRDAKALVEKALAK